MNYTLWSLYEGLATKYKSLRDNCRGSYFVAPRGEHIKACICHGSGWLVPGNEDVRIARLMRLCESIDYSHDENGHFGSVWIKIGDKTVRSTIDDVEEPQESLHDFLVLVIARAVGV